MSYIVTLKGRTTTLSEATDIAHKFADSAVLVDVFIERMDDEDEDSALE